MGKIRNSLSLKLSFGILLMAIPVFVVSTGVLFLQLRHIVRQEAVGRATSVLNTALLRVNGYLKTVETATNVNDWLVLEYLHPDSLLAISNRIVAMNRHVGGCSITTEPYQFPQYGKYFSAYSVREGDSVTTVREGEYDYFAKQWYKTPKTLGKACWTDPFDDFNEGTLSATGLIASYCKPLYQADGKFVGVISTDLSLARLAETIESKKPYPHSYFMMLGNDGHYFLHPDTTRLLNSTIFDNVDPRAHADIIALGHEMMAGNEGSMRVVFDGQPCLVCYHPVPGTHWSVALVCPDSDILKGYNRLAYIVVIVIVLGLLAILLMCRRVVAHAIRPLNQLVGQSQLIAAGQYDQQIAHSKRLDVVGQLQNNFATMQESLAKHISNIQQVNEETAQRNEELVKAGQMAEEAGRQKTAFMQNMTHQIRTPLNIILGFAQVVRDNLGSLPDEEMQNIVGIMNHNAKTLNRMVLMLFDSSDTGLSEELNSSKQEEVSCNEVARESIQNTYNHFPDIKVEFVTTLPDTFCIRTNRLYLMRSLREILYNSAKYSDGKHVSLRVTEDETTVSFIFEDTGPGIAEEDRERLFLLFTKVNDLSEGLGLGLPLARRHILNLGGDIVLDTNYHDGCRFVISLPKT